jgi:hypothetical protein
MASEKGKKQGFALNLDREVLTWVVGGGATIVALVHLLGWSTATWLLLMGGLLILFFATYRTWRDPKRWQALKQWGVETNYRVIWVILGSLLISIGLITRFGPRDIGLFLAIAGVLLLIGGIWYLRRSFTFVEASFSQKAVLPATNESESEEEDISRIAQSSENFRWRVTEAVFNHAKTTSQLNFIVGLLFFVVGIGLFILMAYGVFQLQTPKDTTTAESQFSTYLAQELSSRLNAAEGQSLGEALTQLSPLILLILREIAAKQLVPLISLIIIAWIGSRLIVNAIRLNQRRIIKESLSELGPLQDTLAGIPPRKPFLQVVDQGLRHTRRAFTIRLWLSIILGAVGISLLIVTAIRGLQPGTGDWITTATVGASGVISFIVSLVTTRQKEIGDNLIQVIREETQVAQNAQRSEIVDLYVAQLLRSGAKPQQLKEVLEILDNPQESKLINDEIT